MPPKTAEVLPRSFRTQRLKWAWFLLLPFLLLSQPTPKALLLGGALSLVGLLLRGLAAGSILKDQLLATSGVYAWVRHPLYAGSLLVGGGLSLASGAWWIPLVFLFLFLGVYGLTLSAEEKRLEIRFGEEYLVYRRRVGAFFPNFRSHRGGAVEPLFRSHLYLRNKEWQAALGVASAFLLLWLRMVVPT